jgi:hypothetical protein
VQRLCFLAPEPVPESLLDVKVPGAAEAGDPHAALDDLTAYSLATRDPEGNTFMLHRLVMDVTRRGLAQAGAGKQRLTEALGWVDAAFTGNAQDVRTWPVLTPLAPHAEAVAGYADAAGIAEPTLDVMGRLDMLFDAMALPARAEIHSRRALAIAESNFPPADPRIATRLNNLAQLLQDTHRLGEAEPLMRRALDIDEASYGPDHPKVAIDPVLCINRHQGGTVPRTQWACQLPTYRREVSHEGSGGGGRDDVVSWRRCRKGRG